MLAISSDRSYTRKRQSVLEELAVIAFADKIQCMREKKDKKGRGRPATGRTPSVTIFARVPPQLAEALEMYLNGLRPKPSTTAVVIAALEDFLQAKGFWPLKQPKE
jgi:hypothetical protein